MRTSKKLKEQIRDYLGRYHIPLRLVLNTDLSVALIRIGTPEATEMVEELLKKRITATVRDVLKRERAPVADLTPRVSIVRPRTYNRLGWSVPIASEIRFQKIQVGMTKEQILKRGVPKRDISRWTKSGNIVWSTP